MIIFSTDYIAAERYTGTHLQFAEGYRHIAGAEPVHECPDSLAQGLDVLCLNEHVIHSLEAAVEPVDADVGSQARLIS